MNPAAIGWPVAAVLVVLIASVTVLGLREVLPALWIEHALTALIAFGVGHALRKPGAS